MTKDEFDALEAGDQVNFDVRGEKWLTIKRDPVFTWTSLDGRRFVDHLNYEDLPRPRKKQDLRYVYDYMVDFVETRGNPGMPYPKDTFGYAASYDRQEYYYRSPQRPVTFKDKFELAAHMGLSVLFGVDKTPDTLRPTKTPPKISDYPHVCDCGAPAFAGFFSVDCKAKCANPNVRNV